MHKKKLSFMANTNHYNQIDKYNDKKGLGFLLWICLLLTFHK